MVHIPSNAVAPMPQSMMSQPPLEQPVMMYEPLTPQHGAGAPGVPVAALGGDEGARLLAGLRAARGEHPLLRALRAISDAQRRGVALAKADLLAAATAAREAPDAEWTPLVAAAFHDVMAASPAARSEMIAL